MLIWTQVTISVHKRSRSDRRSFAGMLGPSHFLHGSLGIPQYSLPNHSRAIAHRICFLHRGHFRTGHSSTRPIRQCYRLFCSRWYRVWCSTHSHCYGCSTVNAAQIDRRSHGLYDLLTRHSRCHFLGDQCRCLQYSPEERLAKICRKGRIGCRTARHLPSSVHGSLERR